MTTPSQMKRCSRCKEFKAVAQFSCEAYCRPCRNNYARARHFNGEDNEIKLTTEQKIETTERGIAERFSKLHADAIHRMAFSPGEVSDTDLRLAMEVFREFPA